MARGFTPSFCTSWAALFTCPASSLLVPSATTPLRGGKVCAQAAVEASSQQRSRKMAAAVRSRLWYCLFKDINSSFSYLDFGPLGTKIEIREDSRVITCG